jgi:hypothetical protein
MQEEVRHSQTLAAAAAAAAAEAAADMYLVKAEMVPRNLQRFSIAAAEEMVELVLGPQLLPEQVRLQDTIQGIM